MRRTTLVFLRFKSPILNLSDEFVLKGIVVVYIGRRNLCRDIDAFNNGGRSRESQENGEKVERRLHFENFCELRCSICRKRFCDRIGTTKRHYRAPLNTCTHNYDGMRFDKNSLMLPVPSKWIQVFV